MTENTTTTLLEKNGLMIVKRSEHEYMRALLKEVDSHTFISAADMGGDHHYRFDNIKTNPLIREIKKFLNQSSSAENIELPGVSAE